MKRFTTRTERLGWSAAEALSLLDQEPAAELSTVALAMAEQLQAAAVPLESLDLCIVYWSRALDGLMPGEIPQERLDRLDADLFIEAASSAALARWLDALRLRARTTEDLDRTIQLLMRSRAIWLLSTRNGS